MNRKNLTNALLLLFFFITEIYKFPYDIIGQNLYDQKLMLGYSAVFCLVNREWPAICSYYSLKRIDKAALRLVGITSSIIIFFRVLSFIANAKVRQSVIDVSKQHLLAAISPFLEELFFTGIIFNTIWVLLSNDAGHENRKMDLSVVIPFLLTFYWFLIGHQYETDFLNQECSFSVRVNSFPTGILFGFFCSIYLFVKTRSLILSTFCHYLFNGLVYFWLYFQKLV